MSLWKIPIPDDDDFFEELCCEIWKRIWNTDDVEIFGRNGQTQDGVDIYYDSEEKIYGIQCKCVTDLTKRKITEEIEKAKKFKPNLDSYIIATTVKRDTHLSKHVLKKSKENKENCLFDIRIKFWDDILFELKKSTNSDILKNFFPEFYRDEIHVSKILDDAFDYFKKENYHDAEVILNSLKENTSELSKDNRYKHIILNAKFHELCYQYKEAGKLFIESYDYSCEDLHAKFYKALGLFYIGNHEASEKLCFKIIEKDSLNDDAISLLILMGSDFLIPKRLENSSKILYNKGIVEFKRNHYQEAYELFKKSINNDTIKSLVCTTARFMIFRNSDNFPINLSPKKLKKMESIYQKNLDKFPDNILKYHKDSFYNLLSINSLNENWKSLSENIEKGIELGFDDENFIYLHGSLLSGLGKNEEAIDKIKEFIYSNEQFSRLYVKILIDMDETDLLIDFCETKIKQLNETSEDFFFYMEFLLKTFLKKGLKDEADTLVNNIETDFYKNLFKAQIIDDSDERIKLLYKCLNDIGNVHFIFKFKLSKYFMAENNFKIPISIFEKYLDIHEYSLYLEDLIYCYYVEGEYKKLIRICEDFIKKGEYYRYLFEFEIKCFIKINDYEKVKKLINLYSKKHEKSKFMKFIEARINIIQGNYEKLDLFLKETPNFREIGFELSKEFYYLNYLKNSCSPKLLDILFNIRLVFKNSVNIHEWFVQEIIRLNLDFIEPLKIDYDMGILINFDGIEKWIYVTDDIEYNLNINQFNYIEEIINHEVGDEIHLENGFEIKILKIVNKYQYAFQKSFSTLEFSKTNNVHPYKFNDIKDSLDLISKFSSNKSKLINKLSDTYKNKQMPMILFSSFSNMDIVDTYNFLRTLGLKSFSNNENYLDINKQLVLDISCLMTCYSLGILELVKENYVLSTSYSVLLILKELFIIVRTDLSRESFSVIEENGEYFRVDNNYENKFKTIDTLIKFIEKNCELIPSYKLFELNSKQKEIINILDESYITEPVLIAMDNKILVSDDLPEKLLISQDFNIESCGSLTLIKDMHSKRAINREEYDNLIIKLFLLNFNNVPLTSEMIYKSIKNENLNVVFKLLINFNKYPNDNFKKICNELLKKLDETDATEYICRILLLNTLSLMNK